MAGTVSIGDLRAALRSGSELAFLDLREEGPFSRAQPLFAVNLPLSELELRIFRLVPRRSAPVRLFDDGRGLAEIGARRLADLGYADIALVAGDLAAWRRAGGELFRDVNVPSKAFGEWVADHAHTPMVSAEELQRLRESGEKVVLLDARPFSEYRVMTIPGSVNVPGAELVLRARDLVPAEDALVVVNCAGRTRSILGAQSLVNSGLFGRVAALRNGTIGWLLAGFELERGAARRAPEAVSAGTRAAARAAARGVAARAGVRFVGAEELARWEAEAETRTLFRFDVRSPEEYAAAHAPGFAHAPGGQLVQATDEYVGVRGARIVLADDDGVRAAMTASWLRQIGWEEVAVLDEGLAARLSADAPLPADAPEPPEAPEIAAADLASLLAAGSAAVIDLARSTDYLRGHLPGAWHAARARLPEAIPALPGAAAWVLTSPDGALARFAHAELAALTHRRVLVLAGGTRAWEGPLEVGSARFALPPDDVYQRPYEGTDSPREAMRGYIDWELQLVEQLRRDGTAGFRLI